MSDLTDAQIAAAETGDAVWYINLFQPRDHTFPLAANDDYKTSVSLTEGIGFGRLAIGEAPERLWIREGGEIFDNRVLPPIIIYGGLVVVTDQVAAVLRRHEMGMNALKPVRLFKSDKRTPFDGDWHVFQIAAKKEAYAPDYSKNIIPRQYEDDPHLGTFQLSSDPEGKRVCRVTTAALEGADFWRDPLLNRGCFLSDALYQDLQAQNLLYDKLLRRCAVVAP